MFKCFSWYDEFIKCKAYLYIYKIYCQIIIGETKYFDRQLLFEMQKSYQVNYGGFRIYSLNAQKIYKIKNNESN